MTRGLERWHDSGLTHFLTFSCYQRRPYLRDKQCCDAVLAALEAARQRFGMRVYGYVVMPEHVHLLVSEPDCGTLADVMHFLKLSSAKRLRPMRKERGEVGSLWQKPLSLTVFVITSEARDLLFLSAATVAAIVQRFLGCGTFTIIQ
jgi:REP element-mobilizing transposase RayT